jgi:hypothetical protein
MASTPACLRADDRPQQLVGGNGADGATVGLPGEAARWPCAAAEHQNPSKPAAIAACHRCGHCPKVMHRDLIASAEQAVRDGVDRLCV